MKEHPLSPPLREVTVSDVPSLSPRRLGRELFGGKRCEEGFLRMAAPVPPKHDTRFLVRRARGRVAVAVMLGVQKKSLPHQEILYRGSIELLFGFRSDNFGFTQYVFQQGREVFIREFAPYPETKTTAVLPPQPLSFQFLPLGAQSNPYFLVPKILFLCEFRESDLFRHGSAIGFNVCRNDADTGEFSSWNFLAGNGAPDAASLGRLNRSMPSKVSHFEARVLSPAKEFRVSVTNDTPMIICNHAYTPASLDAEMEGLAGLGVRRLHWIDFLNFPGFWAMPGWRKNYRQSVKNCGDLLEAACHAARKHELELIPDFKIFDLAFPSRDGTTWNHDRVRREGAPDLLCIPEMRDAPLEAFQQTNLLWRKEPHFPITTLRIFSLCPLVSSLEVKLWQSGDNKEFTLLDVPRQNIRINRMERGNLRWSPDGIHRMPGNHVCWMIELREVQISEKFLKIEILGGVRQLQNRHFAFIEAIGCDGSAAPFICSDATSHGAGGGAFDFFGAWPAWNNYNDHAVEFTTLNASSFGIALVEPSILPGLLEPTHPVARKIWMGRIDQYLAYDIAGIGIRSLCHHRRCHSWLQYAFAPSAVAAFEEEVGRPPQCTENDFAILRRVRGAALGDFLEEASVRIRAKKKKVVFQVETGSELPPDRDARMALFFDYEKWISSGIFDELHVRSISGHSPWLRNAILPLARKHGVEVHLITRNHMSGYGHGELLEFKSIALSSRKLGYHGVNFYESANLYELTNADSFLPRALAAQSIRTMAQPSL